MRVERGKQVAVRGFFCVELGNTEGTAVVSAVNALMALAPKVTFGLDLEGRQVDLVKGELDLLQQDLGCDQMVKKLARDLNR